jgi:hypothetical protein
MPKKGLKSIVIPSSFSDFTSKEIDFVAMAVQRILISLNHKEIL